jgi:predicted site-specific integrase-resolvase
MSGASTARVTHIPATINLYQQSILRPQKRRAAVYARVSTDKEEQETSFVNQVAFFTKLYN